MYMGDVRTGNEEAVCNAIRRPGASSKWPETNKVINTNDVQGDNWDFMVALPKGQQLYQTKRRVRVITCTKIQDPEGKYVYSSNNSGVQSGNVVVTCNPIKAKGGLITGWTAVELNNA